MRTLPETRARSAQEAGKRARKLSRYMRNQACTCHKLALSRLYRATFCFPARAHSSTNPRAAPPGMYPSGAPAGAHGRR
eukprot:scaffold27298_cov32-Phaeocystis_antarctica.AAC.1